MLRKDPQQFFLSVTHFKNLISFVCGWGKGSELREWFHKVPSLWLKLKYNILLFEVIKVILIPIGHTEIWKWVKGEGDKSKSVARISCFPLLSPMPFLKSHRCPLNTTAPQHLMKDGSVDLLRHDATRLFFLYK